jgi:hypothetical protein
MRVFEIAGKRNSRKVLKFNVLEIFKVIKYLIKGVY